MSEKIKSLKLNQKNTRKYWLINSVVFVPIILFAIFTVQKIIFPSQRFYNSFENPDDPRDNITDISLKDNSLTLFTSTNLEFSYIKMTLNLEEKNNSLENLPLSTKKSFKAFFYPQGEDLENLNGKEENRLVSVGESVYIVGNGMMTPINTAETFIELGYQWQNVEENNQDLSSYEKQKLTNINFTHPTGTILKTTENNQFYFIENQTKRKILNVKESEVKNPISVNQASLDNPEICQLKKINSKKYSCLIPTKNIAKFIGKDYMFSLENIPDNAKLKNLELQFKKSTNWENMVLFLKDFKMKIFNRFE